MEQATTRNPLRACPHWAKVQVLASSTELSCVLSKMMSAVGAGGSLVPDGHERACVDGHAVTGFEP